MAEFHTLGVPQGVLEYPMEYHKGYSGETHGRQPTNELEIATVRFFGLRDLVAYSSDAI